MSLRLVNPLHPLTAAAAAGEQASYSTGSTRGMQFMGAAVEASNPDMRPFQGHGLLGLFQPRRGLDLKAATWCVGRA